ncbi:hypothetical protein [Novilysobacter spongiicola]|uniref:hypothetical protein n=1 Tax=Novilysobacter spongiicola TaxID=435289 RepID=UPI00117C3A2E|nr:hypothetical protein [Lysobacter spongiicola]
MTTSLEDHRTGLRATYVGSSPGQRLKVALDRLGYPTHEPNLLITRVSAVEALARSLLVHRIAAAGENIEKVYARYRLTGPEALLEAYFTSIGSGSALHFFGQERWEQFQHAVQYRHLLVHECTYLHPETAMPLIETCREILLQLARSAGLPTGEI